LRGRPTLPLKPCKVPWPMCSALCRRLADRSHPRPGRPDRCGTAGGRVAAEHAQADAGPLPQLPGASA
jgi:hypothetical protein